MRNEACGLGLNREEIRQDGMILNSAREFAESLGGLFNGNDGPAGIQPCELNRMAADATTDLQVNGRKNSGSPKFERNIRFWYF